MAWARKTMTSFSGWEGMGRDGPFFRRNHDEYMMKQPRICVPQFFLAQTKKSMNKDIQGIPDFFGYGQLDEGSW